MAFKTTVSFELVRKIILVLIALPLVASNIDCGGKAFHCVNSTHFMICVDLGGGVSSTIDSFVIPCPPSTVCQGSNHFECEFPRSTTVLPTTTDTNVPSELRQSNNSVIPESSILTTTANAVSEIQTTDINFNTVSITTTSEDIITTEIISTESIILENTATTGFPTIGNDWTAVPDKIPASVATFETSTSIPSTVAETSTTMCNHSDVILTIDDKVKNEHILMPENIESSTDKSINDQTLTTVSQEISTSTDTLDTLSTLSDIGYFVVEIASPMYQTTDAILKTDGATVKKELIVPENIASTDNLITAQTLTTVSHGILSSTDTYDTTTSTSTTFDADAIFKSDVVTIENKLVMPENIATTYKSTDQIETETVIKDGKVDSFTSVVDTATTVLLPTTILEKPVVENNLLTEHNTFRTIFFDNATNEIIDTTIGTSSSVTTTDAMNMDTVMATETYTETFRTESNLLPNDVASRFTTQSLTGVTDIDNPNVSENVVMIEPQGSDLIVGSIPVTEQYATFSEVHQVTLGAANQDLASTINGNFGYAGSTELTLIDEISSTIKDNDKITLEETSTIAGTTYDTTKISNKRELHLTDTASTSTISKNNVYVVKNEEIVFSTSSLEATASSFFAIDQVNTVSQETRPLSLDARLAMTTSMESIIPEYSTTTISVTEPVKSVTQFDIKETNAENQPILKNLKKIEEPQANSELNKLDSGSNIQGELTTVSVFGTKGNKGFIQSTESNINKYGFTEITEVLPFDGMTSMTLLIPESDPVNTVTASTVAVSTPDFLDGNIESTLSDINYEISTQKATKINHSTNDILTNSFVSNESSKLTETPPATDKMNSAKVDNDQDHTLTTLIPTVTNILKANHEKEYDSDQKTNTIPFNVEDTTEDHIFINIPIIDNMTVYYTVENKTYETNVLEPELTGSILSTETLLKENVRNVAESTIRDKIVNNFDLTEVSVIKYNHSDKEEIKALEQSQTLSIQSKGFTPSFNEISARADTTEIPAKTISLADVRLTTDNVSSTPLESITNGKISQPSTTVYASMNEVSEPYLNNFEVDANGYIGKSEPKITISSISLPAVPLTRDNTISSPQESITNSQISQSSAAVYDSMTEDSEPYLYNFEVNATGDIDKSKPKISTSTTVPLTRDDTISSSLDSINNGEISQSSATVYDSMTDVSEPFLINFEVDANDNIGLSKPKIASSSISLPAVPLNRDESMPSPQESITSSSISQSSATAYDSIVSETIKPTTSSKNIIDTSNSKQMPINQGFIETITGFTSTPIGVAVSANMQETQIETTLSPTQNKNQALSRDIITEIVLNKKYDDENVDYHQTETSALQAQSKILEDVNDTGNNSELNIDIKMHDTHDVNNIIGDLTFNTSDQRNNANVLSIADYIVKETKGNEHIYQVDDLIQKATDVSATPIAATNEKPFHGIKTDVQIDPIANLKTDKTNDISNKVTASSLKQEYSPKLSLSTYQHTQNNSAILKDHNIVQENLQESNSPQDISLSFNKQDSILNNTYERIELENTFENNATTKSLSDNKELGVTDSLISITVSLDKTKAKLPTHSDSVPQISLFDPQIGQNTETRTVSYPIVQTSVDQQVSVDKQINIKVSDSIVQTTELNQKLDGQNPETWSKTSGSLVLRKDLDQRLSQNAESSKTTTNNKVNVISDGIKSEIATNFDLLHQPPVLNQNTNYVPENIRNSDLSNTNTQPQISSYVNILIEENVHQNAVVDETNVNSQATTMPAVTLIRQPEALERILSQKAKVRETNTMDVTLDTDTTQIDQYLDKTLGQISKEGSPNYLLIPGDTFNQNLRSGSVNSRVTTEVNTEENNLKERTRLLSDLALPEFPNAQAQLEKNAEDQTTLNNHVVNRAVPHGIVTTVAVTTRTSTESPEKYTSQTPNKEDSANSNGLRAMDPFCLTRNRGRYADPQDCTTFYICIGKTNPIVGKCPVNTVFSEIKKQCTKNKSHCVRGNEFQCLSEGRFSDILKNNAYYICVKRQNIFMRFKFQCQNGYYLNKITVRCTKQLEANNQSSTSLDEKSEKSGSEGASKETKKSKNKRKDDKDENKFECKKEGKFADPDNCRKFYVCTKTKKSEFRMRRKSCDSDELFHKDNKKCVDADSYEC